ncbi:hypothetical protein DM02DRAFT_680005 [Periconia macrospinosa]|uniref:Lytic polysaccharide monooxygenase n=1 Tax=Periconia macrospinosa TaxID=97972 RepID=A0A2V1E7B7_9PLEO|nr:hypothetical protein DM02DRAFT_680005 [Periconia macrospinosa]
MRAGILLLVTIVTTLAIAGDPDIRPDTRRPKDEGAIILTLKLSTTSVLGIVTTTMTTAPPAPSSSENPPKTTAKPSTTASPPSPPPSLASPTPPPSNSDTSSINNPPTPISSNSIESSSSTTSSNKSPSSPTSNPTTTPPPPPPPTQTRLTPPHTLPPHLASQLPKNWPYTQYAAALKPGQTATWTLTASASASASASSNASSNASSVPVAILEAPVLWFPRPLGGRGGRDLLDGYEYLAVWREGDERAAEVMMGKGMG